MSNKRYTEEFKIEAVRQVIDRGYSNDQLSYSLPADSAAGDIVITRVIPGGQALCEELAGAN